jgi:hypothetical protein
VWTLNAVEGRLADTRRSLRGFFFFFPSSLSRPPGTFRESVAALPCAVVRLGHKRRRSTDATSARRTGPHDDRPWKFCHLFFFFLEKVYFSSPNFRESPLFLLQLQNRANHLPQLFKPCILPPWSGFEDGFATVNGGFATVRRFCLFLFISAEFLKNHSKSQKNHKMENLILLEST